MDDFSARALELAARIEADRADPVADGELEELRALWRSLDGSARSAAADAARALADAQARGARAAVASPPMAGAFTSIDEHSAAQLALKGLDRIAVRTSPARLYAGPREPDALLEHCGYRGFRPGQREAVQAALDGRDSLVVMPTGGGKSLCYQLPGVASSDLTVVVSPLIALMADQYRRLVLDGHPAAMIASGMDDAAVVDALRAVRDGAARIVFCSPERFASASFLSALSSRAVDLFVVDEAHCVSEWGHDFRPDYLRLRGVIDRLDSPTVMACTATATEQVAEEIRARLGLRDPFVVRSGFDRPNLSFDVIPFDGRGSNARKYMVLSAALADLAKRPSIVYCGTRKDVEEVSEQLRGGGLQAVGYHAGMPADERASAQYRFMEGDADVVVATNAFGMGIDKADVRSVIHWAIPKSVESYYQEVGRGGRDGGPASAILLAMRADLGRLIRFIEHDGVEAGEVLSYIDRLRASQAGRSMVIEAPLEAKGRVCLGVAERAGLCALAPAPQGRLEVTFADAPDTRRVAAICRVARDRGWRSYRAVEAFASPSGGCRRRALLDHFGDARAGRPSGRCCDVCDPATIGLPDPASLTPPRPARRKPTAAAVADPADASLLAALKQWRWRTSAGKPAYTVAHNSTLASIAALKPSTRVELAAVKGVGPAFLDQHAEQVLALVAAAGNMPSTVA
jgi:RecQ family ATP-dependent DNA helicase